MLRVDPHGAGALRRGHEGELLADDPRLVALHPGGARRWGCSSRSLTKSQLVANQVAVLRHLPAVAAALELRLPHHNMPAVLQVVTYARAGHLLHRHPERASTCGTSGSPSSGRAFAVLVGDVRRCWRPLNVRAAAEGGALT
ncbi:MAG: hypothetical protein MZV70_50160 [Desulfobacterales bacterium]|nr:hypothetical protein [Desulfobacterales bacterium]